jgi:hypothetical protein
MAQTSSKANAYVQSASGIWTPVGYSTASLPAPSAITSPNMMQNGGYAAFINPYGTQRVTNDPTTLFYEGFESTTTLDTAVRWTVGGTVSPTQQGGYLAVNSGTAAGGSSRLTSQPLFAPPGQGFVIFACEVGLEAAALANTYRFWGWGSDATSPAYQGASATTSLALYDGVGFETDTTGNIYGVVYTAGSASFRSPIITRPSDGAVHRYMIMRRHDAVYWYTDSLEYPVASATRVTPSAQSMPVKFAAYNGAALTGSPSFNVVTANVSDSTGLSRQISDGTYPHRKAKINATGDQVVSLSSPAAIAAGYYAQVNPYGTQRVSVEPTTLLNETFDTGAVDTAKWTVTATGGVGLTAATGIVQIPPAASSTTAGFIMRLGSVPTFAVPGSGYLLFQATLTVNAAAIANTYRFFGFANDAASPAYQAPGAATSTAVADAIGFELDGSGVMYAVIYVNTSAAFRAVIPTSLWADGNFHRFYMMRSGNQIFWYVDSLETPVATRNVQIPGLYNDLLPLRFLSYNNTTAPAANFLQVSHIAVSDSTAQNQTISDPTYQFRRVQVTPAAHMKAQAYSATASSSTVAATTASALVLAANTARVGATVYNEPTSGAPAYLGFAATATTAAYVTQVPVGGYYETPYGYTGPLAAITATGAATLRVNELT